MFFQFQLLSENLKNGSMKFFRLPLCILDVVNNQVSSKIRYN